MQKGILTIDANKIMKGWALDFTASNSTGVEAPFGKYSKSTAISLFRYGKIGQIAPGETFTDVADASTRVTGLPLNGVVDSAGEAFCILDNARVVQFGTGDLAVDAHNATAHGAHTGLVGEDILNYKNATDEYVLYLFRDNTDADGGRRTKSSGVYDDDFLSTVGVQTNGSTLTVGVPHKAIIAPDNFIYITNGQYLAQLNPSTSAIDYQKLNLGIGFIATGLKVYRNYLVIVGYKNVTSTTSYTKSESRAWFWDTVSLGYNQVYDAEDNYVSAAEVQDDRLYVFTSGRNNTTKIKVFTGSGFSTVFESAQIGSIPRPGSIDIYQNMIHYSPTSGSQLFCFDGNAFHYRTVITSDGETSSSDIGMIKNLTSSLLFSGRKVGSNYYISYMDTNYHKNADFRTASYELPYKSKIEKIVVYFSQFGTGASILVSLFKNYATLSLGGASDLTNETITNSSYGNIASVSFPVTNAKEIETFYMNIRFNHSTYTNTAAIIRKIEIHYITPERV